MRKVTYIGDRVNLGRHGLVDTGDVLFLREYEWQDVKEDGRFKLEQSIKESAQAVFPCKVGDVDLRQVRWNSGRLDKYLARMRRGKLLRIATALQELGTGLTVEKDMGTVDLIDAIQMTAVNLGWCSLTKDEIYFGSRIRKKVLS